ncbi:MAG: GatB/YqeY domain-containing protein [Rhodospirillaceae bacterium]|nr:GatB/YqeY domain-containing protein [Rhodospirillaceae bacterium]
MLRTRLSDSLKVAMKARDDRSVSALRLILAGLKDRDIAARTKGAGDGIPEDEILQMMQNMVRQCRDSIALYEQGGRPELAEKEASEIAIIESFLPRQLSESELGEAVAALMAELGAASIKDMGRVMAALKERFAGRIDFAKAGAVVKSKLS